MAVKDALNGLPKQFSTAISDVRKIAEGMQTLPELLKTLQAIEHSTVKMEKEVTKMREAVERLEGEVEEVGQTLHPVRRAFSRRKNGDDE